MPSIFKINGTARSLQPIIHRANTPDEGVLALGNQSFHRKMKVFYEGKPVLLPVISGNSIRGIMRRLGGESFLELLQLDPNQIHPKLYYLLFSGGSLEEGGGKGKRKSNNEGQSKPAKIVMEELRRKIPLVSLLGCSYQNQILQGKVMVDFLIPYVDEVAELYGKPKPGIRAGEITDWLFYTRVDDLEQDEKQFSNQMIYTMEYILPGIEFIHCFTLMGTSVVETALFVHLLEELRTFGHIGGKIAQGHGRVEFNYEVSSELSSAPYLDYIRNNRETILKFLQTNW
jgi:hypothetical protein